MADWIDGLERLKALKEQGHLSDSEFELAKRRLLDGDPARSGQTADPDAYSDELISEVASPFNPPIDEALHDPPKEPRQLGMIPKAVLAVIGLVMLGSGVFALTWFLAGGGKAEAEVSNVASVTQSEAKADEHSENTAVAEPPATDLSNTEDHQPEPPVDIVEQGFQNSLKSMDNAPCPRLIAMGGANACNVQIYRNYSQRSVYSERAAQMVHAIERNLAGRCSPSDTDLFHRYSLDLQTRALRKLAETAHTASNVNEIIDMGTDACTDLAFKDQVGG